MKGLGHVVDNAAVIVCCGPGGVGKTTVAAGIGIEAAARGRQVVVVTIDPARRLADALGIPGGLSGEPQEVPVPLDGPGSLSAMMLDTPAMFERVVRSHAANEEQADRIVENRFYRNMAGALSGTQEYMASEALNELHGDDRFDLVVVDTPPSRNALDFLEAPGVLTRFLDHRAFKLLMMPTRTGLKIFNVAAQPLLKAIGRVVGSDVLADALAFFQAFAGMEAGFRNRAEAVTELLHDDSTHFVLVTAPSGDSVREATWFADQLHDQQFDVAATVVNRMHPRFGTGSVRDAERRAESAEAKGDNDVAAMWHNLAETRSIADAERAQLDPITNRLGNDDLAIVPLLSGDVHDIDSLRQLGSHLFR
jgi:anion-transporting  ArsA/GET3 family ATPase